MFTSSRRTIVLSAVAAAAALGLDKPLAIAAPEAPKKKKPAPSTQQRRPQTAQTPDPHPGFYRYKVGTAECTALYDGIWEKAHDPAFIKNASVAETKQALVAAKLTTSFVPIPISALVVNINGKLILCDAGG